MNSWRQLADLVEEQRAACGQLEAAALEPVGSREGATLVPEELRLDERLGQRRAVDGDEGTLGTPARIVDGARDQFLARAALPGEQHGGLCRSDARRLIERLPEGRSLADDPIEAVLVAQGPPEPRDSLFELPGSPFDGGEPALLLSKALMLYRHHDVNRDPRGDLHVASSNQWG